jgi:hypothetical protein
MTVDDNWINQAALLNILNKLKYANYNLTNFQVKNGKCAV